MKHGYVTEVAYQPSFHPEQAPAAMRLAAALNGFAVPPAESFRSMEIGCGAGLTLAILAAANPGSDFTGFDFMPEHVAAGQALSRAGSLANAHVVEGDIASFTGHSEANDWWHYVSAHGVYTWVAPALRERLVKGVAAMLKPGGLFYVSYNAMPGWAAVQPLRRLLLDVAERAKGELPERARAAVAFAEHFRQHGGAYFAQNPAASAMLGEILQKDVSYVLHEHFNDDSTALSFAEVARDMARHDLHFVGQLPLHLNYKDLAVPASCAPMFEGAEDRAWFETLKDYATNAFFRRDVYQKGAAKPAPEHRDRYLADGAFGTVSPAADVPRSVRLPHCTMGFSGTIYEAMIEALGDAPSAVAGIAARKDLGAFTMRQVLDALRNMLVAGLAVPMRPRGVLAEPPELNRALVARWTPADGSLSLASPLTGSGVTIDAAAAARLAKGESPSEVVRLRVLPPVH